MHFAKNFDFHASLLSGFANVGNLELRIEQLEKENETLKDENEKLKNRNNDLNAELANNETANTT